MSEPQTQAETSDLSSVSTMDQAPVLQPSSDKAIDLSSGQVMIPSLGQTVTQTGQPITHRESMQRVIVYFVLALLTATFGALIVRWCINPGLEMDSFSGAILAPVLALSGPVLGFYFNKRR